MGDFTVVYFKGIERGFSVPSILSDFSFFGLQLSVKWYGVLIAFGFLAAVLFGGRLAYKWKMNMDKMIDVLIYGTILGIIGARLFYVISQWSLYKNNISGIFHIWEGGLSIYGGLIGGLIAAFIVCRVRKLNFYNLLDVCALGLLLGQGIGRWGNYANQDSFGTNTNMPWGMWSSKIADYIAIHHTELLKKGYSMNAGTPADMAFVHPVFLYESIWCLIGFGLLWLVCKKYRKFSGQLILCYGIWYGVGRIIIDGFRTDSALIANTSIRVSQLILGVFVLAFAAALIVLLKKYKKNPKPVEGVDFFPVEEEKVPAGKKAKVTEKAVKAKETINSGEDTYVEENIEDTIGEGTAKDEEADEDTPAEE